MAAADSIHFSLVFTHFPHDHSYFMIQRPGSGLCQFERTEKLWKDLLICGPDGFRLRLEAADSKMPLTVWCLTNRSATSAEDEELREAAPKTNSNDNLVNKQNRNAKIFLGLDSGYCSSTVMPPKNKQVSFHPKLNLTFNSWCVSLRILGLPHWVQVILHYFTCSSGGNDCRCTTFNNAGSMATMY